MIAFFDGDPVKDVEMKPNDKGFDFEIPYTAGNHVLELKNAGSDWYTLGSISIPGIAPVVRIEGVKYKKWSLYRLRRSTSASTTAVLSTLPLADGTYKLTMWNLTGSGTKTTFISVIHHGFSISVPYKDAIVRLSQ